ncbi:MAG: hypothetical protein IPK58_24160 [Acidobacteria bacterium]|nr:hypothetical protein [Acidobacteriota bacterium]
MRNQYGVSPTDAANKPKDGKYKLSEVKVDLNGDGIYEEKQLVVSTGLSTRRKERKVKK